MGLIRFLFHAKGFLLLRIFTKNSYKTVVNRVSPSPNRLKDHSRNSRKRSVGGDTFGGALAREITMLIRAP